MYGFSFLVTAYASRTTLNRGPRAARAAFLAARFSARDNFFSESAMSGVYLARITSSYEEPSGAALPR